MVEKIVGYGRYLFSEALGLFNTVANELSMGDSTLKPIVGIFLLGLMSFLLRRLLLSGPKSLSKLISRRFITSLTVLDDASTSSINYIRFMRFIDSDPRVKLKSKRFRLVITKDRNSSLGICNGLHHFWFNGRLYWVRASELESSGSDKEKSKIVISTFGLGSDTFSELIEAFALPKISKKGIYARNQRWRDDWNRIADIQNIGFDDLVLDPEIKELLIKQIDFFMNRPDWYRKNLIDHKLVILLYGPPGTGKSSLVKAIARYMDYNIHLLSLSSQCDEFSRDFSTVPSDSIALLEDFEDHGQMVDDVLYKKKYSSPLDEDQEEQPRTKLTSTRRLGGVKLSTFVNLLQGVSSDNSRVVIMTTNDKDILHEKIYRPGRVNLLLEIGPVNNEQIHEYLKKKFKDQYNIDHERLVFEPTVPALLGQCLERCEDSIDEFVYSLKKTQATELTQTL